MTTERIALLLATSGILHTLICATLASSAAIVLVLVLRNGLRRYLSAAAAYAVWSAVPMTVAAALLPAPVLQVPMRLLPVVENVAHTTVDVTPRLAASAMHFDAAYWLIVVWAAGALLALVLLAIQQRRYVRSLGKLARVDRDIVRAQSSAGCPALVGVWRPRIVLPADFEQRYSAGERELILAHERCHRARGDAQINFLAAVLRGMFWFNPLVHFAASRLRFDQELACDAAVISRFPRARRTYADAMLKTQLADFGLPLGCHWQSLHVSQSGHSLKERILMLKKPLPGRARAALGLAVAATLVLSGSYAAWAAQPAQRIPVAADANAPASASASVSPNAASDTKIGIRSQHAPDYPQQLIDTGVEGVIGVRAQVDTTGNVTDAHIVFADPPSVSVLEASSVAAIQSWTFDPATVAGQPIASSIVIPIRFRIDGHDDVPMPALPADAWDGIVVLHDKATDVATAADSPPRAKYVDWPEYSDAQRHAYDAVRIVLDVHVDEFGNPQSAVIDSTDPADINPALTTPAIASAMHGKYAAAIKNGKPIAGNLLLESSFRHGSLSVSAQD